MTTVYQANGRRKQIPSFYDGAQGAKTDLVALNQLTVRLATENSAFKRKVLDRAASNEYLQMNRALVKLSSNPSHERAKQSSSQMSGTGKRIQQG